jgi:hypothetical protein
MGREQWGLHNMSDNQPSGEVRNNGFAEIQAKKFTAQPRRDFGTPSASLPGAYGEKRDFAGNVEQDPDNNTIWVPIT